jgi:hypothetical protein
MLQPKKPAKKAESTVIKPTPKKDKYKSLGGEIGRPTGPTTGRVKPTLGGAKSGKTITKAKNGKSFPDLNKDGKITKADILKGRGVIAKKGVAVKKAFLGKMLGGAAKSMLGGLAGKALGGLMGKNGKYVKKAKSGDSMKKCKYGCK